MGRFYLNRESQFCSDQELLADGSPIYAVYFDSPTGYERIAEALSQRVAEELAKALNQIRASFLDCTDDGEALSLASVFSSFIERQKKSAFVAQHV